MAERKFYGVKLNEYEAGALAFAGEVWPEHADNTTELFRQILADWLRIKKDAAEGGTRTQTARMLRLICEHVGIDLEAIDHEHHDRASQ